MIWALVILAVLVLVTEATTRYGLDSRVGAHTGQRRPLDDVHAVARLLTRH